MQAQAPQALEALLFPYVQQKGSGLEVGGMGVRVTRKNPGAAPASVRKRPPGEERGDRREERCQAIMHILGRRNRIRARGSYQVFSDVLIGSITRDEKTTDAQPGPADIPQPEELAVHWLGGYWKLPKRDMCSSDLRERVVSAWALLA